MARSPRKRNQIEEALVSLRRGSPIVEGIRSIPARPTLSEALAQPIYDRPSNVPEVTAGQRTAKRTLGERFTQNREDALQRGIAAALQRSVDAPGFDPATERNRREAYDLLSANDPFYADPNPALAAVATGAGQLVGAMQDPTSYIAPGRTMLGRAVGGAGVGGATDVIAQALDIGSGVADQYNPLQTAGATVAPALLSLGGDALARAGRGAPEAAAPEPIAPEPLAPVQPRRRGPSVFDYAAYEAANPMPRPFETAPNLPPPQTYEEAVDQVQSLQAQLNEAYRDVGRSTSVQNPGVSGMRSLDRRAVLERQLAAARTELERLRPPAPERVNPPGTSEAARAYLERLGMGRVADLGSTRAAAPEPLAPVRPGPTSVSAMGARPGVRTADLDPLGFSSTALEAAKALPDRPLPVSEAMSLIQQGRGVQGMTARTKAEMDFLGLREAFAGRDKVTKQELVDYIEANRLVLGEVTNTKEAGTLRVGSRYDLDDDPNILRGETVITLPPNVPGGAKHGAHTGVEGDLMHVLWAVRTDNKGGKTLFVRQLQSDLAQKGRKTKSGLAEKEPPLTGQTSLWTGAGVRAMIIKASRDGYDSISFPTGETSAVIQGNDRASAHYDQNVRSELEKVAKALGGTVRLGTIESTRATGPKTIQPLPRGAVYTDYNGGGWGAQFDPETNSWMVISEDGTDFRTGFPSEDDALDFLETGKIPTDEIVKHSVYILDIPKSVRTRIQDFGLPLFGVGAAGAMAAGAMQEPERRID